MRIYVYAICKNEEKFVKRWYESMSEADGVFVLDTGSSDETVSKLKTLGATVAVKTIKPWRFDEARNESMKLLPDDCDLAVCTDLDEVFDKGWRQNLEKVWRKGVKTVTYKYVWSSDCKGNEQVVLRYDKIHSPKDFIWKYPVHEVLVYTKPRDYKAVFCENIVLRHFPDEKKSRSSYLGLLKSAIYYYPRDPRNYYYLAREYFFLKDYFSAEKTFKKYLSFTDNAYSSEKASAYAFLSDCALFSGDKFSAEKYLLSAISTDPSIREGYVGLCRLYYETKDYAALLFAASRGTKLDDNVGFATDFSINKGVFYDYASIALYHLESYGAAIENARLALKYFPENDRIRKNVDLFMSRNEKKRPVF